MSTKIELRVGHTKPLSWWFKKQKSDEPAILTGHSFVLELTDSQESVTPVPGVLYEGDCNVYFDIQSPVMDTAQVYTFRVIDTEDASGDVSHPAYGTLTYI